MPKVPQSYLDARRTEIVDAAMTCFLRKGFHQTTMRDICKEAQLSPGAVYRYFAGKSEIMSAVIDRNTEQWAQLIELAGQMAPEPGQTLGLVGNYFFNRFHDPGFEQRVRVDIESRPEILRSPKLRARMRDQMATMRRLLVDLVLPRLDAYPDVTPEATVNLYMALYVGLELNKLVDPEGVDVDAVLAALDQLFPLPTPAANKQDAPTAGPFPLRQARAEKDA